MDLLVGTSRGWEDNHPERSALRPDRKGQVQPILSVGNRGQPI